MVDRYAIMLVFHEHVEHRFQHAFFEPNSFFDSADLISVARLPKYEDVRTFLDNGTLPQIPCGLMYSEIESADFLTVQDPSFRGHLGLPTS